MSTITISELHPPGSELFADSESYMNAISEEELAIQGGLPITVLLSSEPCGHVLIATVLYVTMPD